MKLILIISIIILGYPLNSKAQCLENWDFDENNGMTSTYCPYINSSNTLNWRMSHGTPQIFQHSVFFPKMNYAFMWSERYNRPTQTQNNEIGEGMFASFNFQQNQLYKIELKITTSGEALDYLGYVHPSAEEHFKIYAANGISESPYNSCGDIVPVVSDKQLIADVTYTGTNWTILTFNFIPNANYSQIWMYPYLTDNPNPQPNNDFRYEVMVDYIYVCEPEDCRNTITYHNGTLPITNGKHGFINIGNSFGWGSTVTTSGKYMTQMKAAKSILIQHDFITSTIMGTSASFTAEIEPCTSADSFADSTSISQENRLNDTSVLAVRLQEPERNAEERGKSLRQDQSFLLDNGLLSHIYPNPSNGNLRLTLNSEGTNRYTISIMNIYGQQVKRIELVAVKGKSTHLLQTGIVQPGQYFVLISNGTRKSTINKIQIQ